MSCGLIQIGGAAWNSGLSGLSLFVAFGAFPRTETPVGRQCASASSRTDKRFSMGEAKKMFHLIPCTFAELDF